MEPALALSARRPWHLLPSLAVSWLGGVPLTALCVATALGIGVEPLGGAGATAFLLVLAAALAAPAAWITRRALLVRRPARLRFLPGRLVIEYPEQLRAPLEIPHDAIRVAAVGEARWIPVEDASEPDGEEGGEFLWPGSELPVLPPDRGRPNVALLLQRTVPAPPLRRQNLRGLLRGERIAGLMLVVRDAAAAERLLAPHGWVRPLTTPDIAATAALLGAATDDPAGGSRRALQRRRTVHVAWGLVLAGLLVPFLALLAPLLAIELWRAGERRQPLLLAALGTGVFAARLAAYVG